MLTDLRHSVAISAVSHEASNARDIGIALVPPRSGNASIAETIEAAARSIDSEAAARAGKGAVAAFKAARHSMNEHSLTNASSPTTATNCAKLRALAIEEAAPPPRPGPMPTQVIEFWTPRVLFVALLYWIGRAARRALRGAAFSAADTHEPR